jgi:hypothetical protein
MEHEGSLPRLQVPTTRWRRWLRHCTTSRKVRSSIPDSVIRIFHWHYPSGRTIALGLTQPLTEMSTRPVRRADNLTTFICRLSWNLGASTSWNPQGLSRSVMGLLCFYVRVLYPEQATVLFECKERCSTVRNDAFIYCYQFWIPF